ncbi:MAG TPA: suppressor of fused domain protein [Streptosporangiales bacterium]
MVEEQAQVPDGADGAEDPAEEAWRDAIEGHCDRYLGPCPNVIAETGTDLVRIDLDPYLPAHNRERTTVVTVGVSTKATSAPDAMASYRHIELFTYLPSNWSYGTDEAHWWPCRMLKDVGRLVHRLETWYAPGQLLGGDPDEPLTDETLLTGVVLLPPVYEDPAFDQLEIDGTSCRFLWAFPLTTPEIEFAQDRGVSRLLELMAERDVQLPLDSRRACMITGERYGRSNGHRAAPPADQPAQHPSHPSQPPVQSAPQHATPQPPQHATPQPPQQQAPPQQQPAPPQHATPQPPPQHATPQPPPQPQRGPYGGGPPAQPQGPYGAPAPQQYPQPYAPGPQQPYGQPYPAPPQPYGPPQQGGYAPGPHGPYGGPQPAPPQQYGQQPYPGPPPQYQQPYPQQPPSWQQYGPPQGQGPYGGPQYPPAPPQHRPPPQPPAQPPAQPQPPGPQGPVPGSARQSPELWGRIHTGIEQRLNRLLQTEGFLVIEESSTGYYVMLASSRKRSTLTCEAVSNQFLPTGRRLSPEQEQRMRALGWSPPGTGEASTTWNHARTLPMPVKAAGVARVVVATLRDIYGCDPRRLSYTGNPTAVADVNEPFHPE